MLKYSHIQPGQRIRAYDFQPMEGRTDRYVEGDVKAQVMRGGAAVLEIVCTYDSTTLCRKGLTIYVPQETDMESDSYDRVVVIDADQKRLVDAGRSENPIDSLIHVVLEDTPFTYGYIGNAGHHFDDRSWRIFLPAVEGKPRESIGDYCTESRGQLLELAKAVRHGYQARLEA